IAAYDEALRRAPDDIEVLNNKGLALQSLGKLQAGLSQHQDALSSYQQAIAAYDEALRRAPDYIEVLNNKGLLYVSLGQLQAVLELETEALQSLQNALQCLERSLAMAPNDAFIRKLRDQIQAWLDGEGEP
ncbi:MAG: tetratricopeptide repeat protein, partial [Cyanobacteria bacterium P01_A01_bin.70]